MSRSTVKTGLLPFIRSDGDNREIVREWLGKTVDFGTEMSIHASRIALLHVIQTLQAGRPLEHPLNQAFFQQCCSLACFDRSQKEREKKIPYEAFCVYKQCLRANHAPLYPNDPKLHTFQVNNIAREMETNLKVMFKTTFIKRHLFFCRKIVEVACLITDDDDDAKAKCAERCKVVSWLFEQTLRSNDQSIDITHIALSADIALSALSIWTATLRDAVAAAVSACRSSIPVEARPVKYCDLVNAKKVHLYMPWMYQMLKHRVDHNAQHPDQRDQWRLFALMPVRGYDRCFISISTSDLSTFVCKHREQLPSAVIFLGGCTTDPAARKYVQNNTKDALWRHIFNIDGLESGSRKFAHSIRTDGIAVSSSWTRDGTSEDVDDEKASKDVVALDFDDDRRIDTVDLRGKRVIGVDPGKKTVFTSAERPLEEMDESNQSKKHAVKAYSGARWLHESGANEAKKQREKWRAQVESKTPGYTQWLNAMPSTKVVDTESMCKHIKHLFDATMFRAMMQANGARKVRQQKRRNYIKRQSALARMTNELVAPIAHAEESETAKKVVVVFGAANFQCTGPVTKLRVALRQHEKVDRVVDLDEFRTSMLASCCAHKPCNNDEADAGAMQERVKQLEMRGVKGEKKERDGSTKTGQLYSVRVCGLCGTIWNRDVNAAINMLEVFCHAQSHSGERKYEFSRSVKRIVPCEKKGKRKRTTSGTRKKKKILPERGMSESSLQVACAST